MTSIEKVNISSATIIQGLLVIIGCFVGFVVNDMRADMKSLAIELKESNTLIRKEAKEDRQLQAIRRNQAISLLSAYNIRQEILIKKVEAGDIARVKLEHDVYRNRK